MGTQALRAAVEQEAKARVAALRAEAETRARSLREAAAAQAEARRREALRAEEAALRRDAGARVAAARGEAQKGSLEAREALLDRIFAAAERVLPEVLADETARRDVVALAERALRQLPPGPAVLECAETLAPWLGAALAGQKGVRVTTEPGLGLGFRARVEKGTPAVEAVFADLIALHRPALSIEVLRRLGGGP